MTQFDLFEKSDLERKFDEFNRENPHVWIRFQEAAFELIEINAKREEAGLKPLHFSADFVCHIVRYKVISTRSADGFKVNNNHVAYYSRKFMQEFPEHDGLFRTKPVRGWKTKHGQARAKRPERRRA